MKNQKLFFRIMIAIVMTGSFLSIIAQALAQEVIINTDKTEYNLGEEVKLELSFKGAIYAWGFSESWSIQKWEDNSWKYIFINVGCRSYPDCKNANFKEIKDCLGYTLCERPGWDKVEKEGPSSWVTKLAWDQTKGIEKSYKCREVKYDFIGGKRTPVYGGIVKEKCIDFEQVPPGRYKVIFMYALSIDPNDRFKRENTDIKYVEKEIMIK